MDPESHPSALRRALALAKRKTINTVLRALPAEASLRLQYWRAFKRLPDLKTPRRFTEKLQWLKIYGGLEAHSDWIDKVIAKERVAALLGESWITPTLWHGRVLPPREERTWPTPYLIKANHGSGWYHHVVTDADKDWPAIEKMTASWLRRRWHPHLRERQYAKIAPQLLVEPRLGGSAEVLPYDYKFHVFNGRVQFIGVTIERLQGPKLAVMDRAWSPLAFSIDNTPLVGFVPEKPPHFDKMLEGAETLARQFAYARIDFYDLEDGPRFGEITLTPASGHLPLDPDGRDFVNGALLDLGPAGSTRAINPPSTKNPPSTNAFGLA